MNELILNEINLIDKIYKKLTHACYLNLSTDCKRNITHVVEKQWEIIQESSASENIKNIFDQKYPTIFHYSWIGIDYTDTIIEYIDHSNKLGGWPKRFILLGFENCNEIQSDKLLKLFYTKIDNNFYIHSIYKHYLYRK
jgi:hypothetical protein